MNFCNAVRGMGRIDRQTRHVDLTAVRQKIDFLIFAGNPARGKIQTQLVLQHHHIGIHLRRDGQEQRNIPFFECFRHDGVVGVGERIAGKRKRFVERHHIFAAQDAQQLRDRNHRMRIVQLDRKALRQLREIVPMRAPVIAQDALDRRTRKEILLFEAQAFALARVVVGIQHGGDRLCKRAFLRGFCVILAVELRQIKAVYRLGLPQTQRIDTRSAVADHRHIIRDCPHRLIGEPDKDGFLFPPDAPRIPKARPVVGIFLLEAVLKPLLEQAVPVTDPVAVERDVLRRRGIQKTGSKPSQPAVAERIVLYLLKYGRRNPVLLQIPGGFLQQSKVHQIAVNQAAREEFRRKIAGALLVFRLFPARHKLCHRRTRHAVIKLLCGGLLCGGRSGFPQAPLNHFLKLTHI